MTALAKRAVACKGWRWMPGMADVDGCVIVGIRADGLIRFARPVFGSVVTDGTRPGFQWRPDLDDPATLGCFEHGLLADIYGPRFHVQHDGGDGPTPWRSWRWDPDEADYEEVGPRGATKAEAVVAALEAAP